MDPDKRGGVKPEARKPPPLYLAVEIVLMIVTVGAALAAYFVLTGLHRWIAIGGAVVAGALVLYMANALGNRCSKCGAFSARMVKKVETGTEEIARMEDRDTPVKDASGKQIGTTTHSERVIILRTHYRRTFVCRSCQHTWDTDNTVDAHQTAADRARSLEH